MIAIAVMAAVSLTPSLVAVTAAEPTPIAVTRPLASTVATGALSVVQAIGRPASTLPFASRTTADNCIFPCNTSIADAGLTVTDATGRGGVTVTDAVALAVPLVAVIVTLPELTPVTVANARPAPAELSTATVARATSLLIQATEGWSSKRPPASRTVAVSLIVSPAAPTVACVGETATAAGGPALTMTNANASNEPTLARTEYSPAASAVSSPLEETVRPFGSLVDHVTG